MAWSTPSLSDVRKLTRDNVTAGLRGAVLVANSVLRVMADAMGALAHLTLRYIDWLALQLLPDTADTEWLDRHGDIWLSNADGSRGRKAATFATGTVTVTGEAGSVVQEAAKLISDTGMIYETTARVSLGAAGADVPVRATGAGAAGNADTGTTMAFSVAQSGIDGVTTVVTMLGGTDAESDDALRARVLERIQSPPMGGDGEDYVAWARRVEGVSRAWSYPLEMGIGTVTVRFMCDDLRIERGGFPQQSDTDAVQAYLDTVRPVAVKDFFVVAPVPQEISMIISGLSVDTEGVRAAITDNLTAMLRDRAKPGQTIYRSWVDEAISQAVGEDVHDLRFDNVVMTDPNHMPVLGSIIYE